MIGLLIPDEYLPSVTLLDPQRLRARGIRGLIVDLDNTLVPWRGGDPVPGLACWLERVRGAGIAVCILSNNRSARVGAWGRSLGVPVIAAAAKPRRKAFVRAMEVLGTGPAETAVVGDQLFTDVLGGRRLGLYTVLVQPLSRREFVGTRLVRGLERRVLAYLSRRGLLPAPGGRGDGR